jgi:hypothetical protein
MQGPWLHQFFQHCVDDIPLRTNWKLVYFSHNRIVGVTKINSLELKCVRDLLMEVACISNNWGALTLDLWYVKTNTIIIIRRQICYVKQTLRVRLAASASRVEIRQHRKGWQLCGQGLGPTAVEEMKTDPSQWPPVPLDSTRCWGNKRRTIQFSVHVLWNPVAWCATGSCLLSNLRELSSAIELFNMVDMCVVIYLFYSLVMFACIICLCHTSVHISVGQYISLWYISSVFLFQ